MKKSTCLLLILVITCYGVRAQVQTKAAAPAQTQTTTPTQTQPAAPAQTQAVAAAQAQPTHPAHPAPRFYRWSFNVSAGPAYPEGAFAHTDKGDPQSGPVHTGSGYEFNILYRLNHTWGIALSANHQQHTSINDELILPNTNAPEGFAAGPLIIGPGPPYPTIGPQHWTMTRLLAGGAYTLPLNKKKSLALLLRALAGIQQTHVAQYEYSLTYQYLTTSSSNPARNLAWTFSYQADAGLQWKFYRRWSVLAFTGYNGSRPSYNQDITDLLVNLNRIGPNASPVYKKIHFPTGSLLVHAGVGFDL